MLDSEATARLVAAEMAALRKAAGVIDPSNMDRYASSSTPSCKPPSEFRRGLRVKRLEVRKFMSHLRGHDSPAEGCWGSRSVLHGQVSRPPAPLLAIVLL